eukprot:COSAG01_NODE_710_length_14110_cov_94.506745_10_plen_67_part_00
MALVQGEFDEIHNVNRYINACVGGMSRVPNCLCVWNVCGVAGGDIVLRHVHGKRSDSPPAERGGSS